MKYKFTLGFKSVFTRILVFNIVLVLIATVIPQIIYYSYFTNNYDREIRDYNTQNVNKLKYSVDETLLEKVVGIPKNYFSDLTTNVDLNYPLNNDISKDAYRAGLTYQALHDIKLKLSFIDSVEVIYSMGGVYFSDGGVKYMGDEAFSKGLNVDWYKTLKGTTASAYWISNRKITNGETRNVSTYVSNIPQVSTEETRKAVVAVNVKEDALYNLIQFAKPLEGEQLLIIDEGGNVITHSKREWVGRNMGEEAFVHQILQQPGQGHFDSVISGKKSVISFSKSNYNNWYYVSVTSVDTLYKKSNQLKNYLIVICMALLLLNVGISVFFTRKANMPLMGIVKSILNLGIATETAEDKKQSEYKLLSNVINTVTVKMDEFSRQLELNEPVIRYSLIMRLLNGKLEESADAIENMKLARFKFKGACTTCFTIRIFGTSRIGIENELMVKYKMIQLLENNNKGYEIFCVLNETGQLVGSIFHKNKESLEEVMAYIHQEVENLISIRYAISYGRTYENSIPHIHQSYVEVCEGAKYGYILTEHKTLTYEDLKVESRKYSGSSSMLLNKLTMALRDGDHQKVGFCVESVIEGLRSGSYRIEYCLNTLSDAVSQVRSTFMEKKTDIDQLLQYDMREYFKNIEDIEEFQSWILSVIQKGMEVQAETSRNDAPNDLENQIREYIENNIYKDISLTLLSDELHMNASYLSRIFKSITGMNFSEYVTERKLEKAAILLQEEKYPVKEISSMLGYNSPNHFIKIFKEKYECTPKEYQKKSRIV